MRKFSLTILLAILVNLFHLINSHAEHSLLLLVCFDSFRWDYLQKVKEANFQTPNFDFLLSSGVTVGEPGISNVYPTDTAANLYSMVTGQYPERHGLVADYMFDPTSNQTFCEENEKDMLDEFWYNNATKHKDKDYRGPQPIWNINQKYGSGISKKRSGTSSWLVGSEAAIGGDLPEYYDHYNASAPFKSRIDKIISWFATENKPINLGLTYFEEPDVSGHKYGPDSPKLLEKVAEIDELVGYLLQQLKATHLFEKMNIIITSDHGMITLVETIVMSEYLNDSLYQQYGQSPVWHILPVEGLNVFMFNLH